MPKLLENFFDITKEYSINKPTEKVLSSALTVYTFPVLTFDGT